LAVIVTPDAAQGEGTKPEPAREPPDLRTHVVTDSDARRAAQLVDAGSAAMRAGEWERALSPSPQVPESEVAAKPKQGSAKNAGAAVSPDAAAEQAAKLNEEGRQAVTDGLIEQARQRSACSRHGRAIQFQTRRKRCRIVSIPASRRTS